MKTGWRLGGGNHPVLERCTSRGLREVVGEEEGERERQRGRGTKGQRRKDMERKRLTGSNKKNSALPLFQTCGGDGEAGPQTGMR